MKAKGVGKFLGGGREALRLERVGFGDEYWGGGLRFWMLFDGWMEPRAVSSQVSAPLLSSALSAYTNHQQPRQPVAG